MKAILLLISLYLCFSCQSNKTNENTKLSFVTIVNRTGVIETVNNKERLEKLSRLDFYSSQPYQKVLRVYTPNTEGSTPASLTSYHENGQLSQDLSILNGRAYGPLKAWHINGRKMFEAFVIEGIADNSSEAEKSWILDGVAQAWDDEGHLMAQFNYFKGELEGDTLYFYENNQIKEKKTYKKNFLDGQRVQYYPQGTTYKEALYKTGLREGESNTYWENGVLQGKEFYKNESLLNGEYYSQTGDLLSTISQGSGKQFFLCKDQCIHELEYCHGIAEGCVHEYNKKNELIHTYHQKGGEKDGIELIYYPKSKNKLLCIDWKEGKIHGISNTWYLNGKMESQREFSENMKNGLSLAWYEDGELMMIEDYEKDKLKKGEYFEKGSKQPISRIIEGNGYATLFDLKGQFLTRIQYENSIPQQ
jgi:antitoxin component YwqK of YwqJK toxin-antitoxin module